MPAVSRARRQTEWFKTTQNNFKNIKLALQAVGQGIYYDFTQFSPTAMPSDFLGKGRKLRGGVTMDTTTHGFKQSPRLQELKRNLQTGDEVETEDGTIQLNADDVEDIRSGTKRGLYLLELITRKEKATATTQTNAATTGTTTKKIDRTTQAPVFVRMTRNAINQLRDAQTSEAEQRRRRIARALAQLTI
jgi:hypothetical protein